MYSANTHLCLGKTQMNILYPDANFHLLKAKSMLEKALAQEPTYLEAVYLLAEVLGEEQRYTAAIDLWVCLYIFTVMKKRRPQSKLKLYSYDRC